MPRSSALRRVAAGLLCAGTLGSLSCESTTRPVQLPPVALQIVSGNAQEGIAGQRLPEPLVARVVDENGTPVQGQIVNFVVVAGGGSVFAGASISNAQGIVQERWTLGPTPGTEQKVEARAVDNETGEEIVFATFTAIAHPAPSQVGTMTRHEGDQQTIQAGSAAPIPPAVRITDGSGQPVAGREVVFAIESGGGSLTGATATTNADGVARVGSWTVGTQSGPASLRASTADIPSVTFTGTIVAAAPATMTKHAGDNQTGSFGGPVPIRPAVRVTDQYGNPVANVRVTFTVESGGGSVSGAEPLTDAQGIATVGSWTLGSTGTQSLRASATGLSSVLFTANLPDGFYASDMAGGYTHGCALREGVPYCWGWDGTTTILRPVEITGSPTFVEIGAGTRTSCGLTADGALWCWGVFNTPAQASTPRPFVTFDQAYDHRCGLSADGQAWCSSLAAPTDIRFSSIAVGNGHACGVALDGRVYCWGSNSHGQLGRSGGSAAAPISSSASYTRVDAGALHSCAVTTTGEVHCWGYNGAHQLGFASPTSTNVPTAVPGLTGRAVSELALGSWHSCALTSSGEVLCWGGDQRGQVGDGGAGANTVTTPTPIASNHTWRSIAAGHESSCAVTTDNIAYCWGSGEATGTGTGGGIAVTAPKAVLPPQSP